MSKSSKIICSFVAAASFMAFVPFVGVANASSCKVSSAEGWGLTEELAKAQAQDMLLLSTGNILVQTDRFSKPKYQCSFSVLGWTCQATAKVCKN